ncbi:hypothetical protein TL5120_01617 [Thalassovita autumnalis]|nr:hypothetical protein TL5120_01254 [Thalassovita autumnalis]CUH71825.1 hypothetical protein TL5120_01617 [Thalassovita autumnalis]
MQINPFTCVDLGLPLKRQVITIFADQHVRHEAGAGPPAFDQAGRQRGLGESFTAGAGHAWADKPAHDEVTGDVIQLFGHVLAHLAQGATASIACLARRQDLIFPIQMVGQWLAAVLALRLRLIIIRRLPRVLILCGLRYLIVFRQVERQLIHAL